VQIERSDYYILPSFKFHDINKKDDEESDTDSDFDDVSEILDAYLSIE
jgi:hypothetical protein